MKTIYYIFLFVFTSSLMTAQSTITSNTLVANNELKLNGKSYTSIPSSGGQVFLEDYDGANFGQQLQNAIDLLPDSIGIINCRGVGGMQEMDTTVTINKPVRILLGQMTLTMDNSDNENMFNIDTSGVDIIGMGRSVKRDATSTIKYRTGKTKLVMKNSAGNTLNGYHFYNRGYSCITIKDMDLDGEQTGLNKQYGVGSGIDGAGGVYMEKANPDTTYSGNVISQIVLDGLYIEKTKAHGIYLDGPMFCSINNVRISDAGGHGIFIYNGTTCSINSTYVASANYTGFVIASHSYATISNSSAENCTMGWWIRGAHNISIFNPAVEEANNLGYPWTGLKLQTISYKGTLEEINDVNSDYKDDFVGHGFLITGGDYIQLINPYCKDPGSADKESIDESDKTRFLKITESNKYSVVQNLQAKLKYDLKNKYDVEIKSAVKYLTLDWNPEDGGTVTPTDPGVFITNNSNKKAPLYLDTLSSNTNVVKSGAYLFTPYVNK